MTNDIRRDDGAGDRELELRADRALFGLDMEEARELAGLAGDGNRADPDPLELTAAALDIALLAAKADDAELPAHVRKLVLAASRQFVREAAAQPTGSGTAKSAAEPVARVASGVQPTRRELGAWLAAAAAILVASWSLLRPNMPISPIGPQALRESLLAEKAGPQSDIVQVAWTRSEDPAAAKASGEVLWSDRTQRGVMQFRGLAANDPTQNQYQLWIFDKDRNDQYPVDGGVFDVPAGDSEVLVPIQAKLPVSKAVLFAITVEKPGGVVVSDRSRLPLLAKVE